MKFQTPMFSSIGIVQPRLYDSAMAAQITLKMEGPHGLDPCQGHSYGKVARNLAFHLPGFRVPDFPEGASYAVGASELPYTVGPSESLCAVSKPCHSSIATTLGRLNLTLGVGDSWVEGGPLGVGGRPFGVGGAGVEGGPLLVGGRPFGVGGAGVEGRPLGGVGGRGSLGVVRLFFESSQLTLTCSLSVA